MTTVHIAGEPENGVQKCRRCGATLIDYRGVMTTGTRGPGWWGVGAFVGTDGNCSFVMSRDAQQLDEANCSISKVQ